MLSWLPPSPCQTSRDSWKTSGSCRLWPLRDVFGACFSAGSIFPFQDLTIILRKIVQLEDWGSTVYLSRLLTLCPHHITTFCSADFPSLQHWWWMWLETEDLLSAGCLQPFSAACNSSWLPSSRVWFLGAEQHCVLKNGPWKMQVYRGHLTASHSRKQKAERSRAAEGRGTEKEHPSLCHLSLRSDR